MNMAANKSFISKTDDPEKIGEFWDKHDFTEFDDPNAPDVEFMNSPTLTRDLESVRQIILDALQGYRAKVWLFGSQATGRARRYSDIDVAILPLEQIPDLTFSNVRESLEESNILRYVDVVNLKDVSSSFLERVLQEGVLWKK